MKTAQFTSNKAIQKKRAIYFYLSNPKKTRHLFLPKQSNWTHSETSEEDLGEQKRFGESTGDRNEADYGYHKRGCIRPCRGAV